METQNNPEQASPTFLPPGITSATPLTPLELNGYKLDVKHTVLTPAYLEEISSAKADQAADSKNSA